MLLTTCPHCGHSWRVPDNWRQESRCPVCGRREHPESHQPHDEARPKRKRDRAWTIPYGGLLFRLLFVGVVVFFVAYLIWLVTPPLVGFMRGYSDHIEQQAAPREKPAPPPEGR
jgi:hypothetical protein